MYPCDTRLLELDCYTDLAPWLVKYALVTYGAEIGVATGQFAQAILCGVTTDLAGNHTITQGGHAWTGQLYLVDPYVMQDPAIYKDSTQVSQSQQDADFAQVQVTLASYRAQCCYLRLPSVAAAAYIEPEQLDFVHIDANHSYMAVMADLDAWLPKVKRGGLVCGHDFYTRVGKGDCNSDVANAVLNLAELWNVRPHVTWCSTWYFIKP